MVAMVESHTKFYTQVYVLYNVGINRSWIFNCRFQYF